MNRGQALARLLTLLGISWFILWACAPMMSVPPATPMNDAQRQIGVAAHGGGGFDAHLSAEDRYHGEELANPGVVGGSVLWKRSAVGPKQLGQVGWFVHGFLTQSIPCTEDYCNNGGMGAGGFYRKSLGQTDTFSSAVQVSGGLYFVTLGVPLAWTLGDDAWITFQPQLGVAFSSLVHLPVGVSLPVGKRGHFDAQVGMHLGPEALGAVGEPFAQLRDNIVGGSAYYQYMPYLGVGYTMTLGETK